MLRVAADTGSSTRFVNVCSNVVVASIGPTTSEALRDAGLPVDIEPEHPKMGPLVAAAAARTAEILHRKRRVQELLAQPVARPDDRAVILGTTAPS